MQLVNFFNQFMNDEVNLNQTRLNILSNKRTTIQNFIKSSSTFKDRYIDMFSQGSYKHRTIIKPPKSNKEFDADILLELEPNEDWEDNPKEYVNELHKLFKDSQVYKNIVVKNTRCITLDYSGDFHIDIVPYVNRSSLGYITNRNNNTFEETNPKEFTQWLMNKNKISNYQLKKVIRLFKYMRDIKQTFTVKSILLNTLLANQVYPYDQTADYINLPTAFKLIINRLNDYLQANPFLPNIVNPKMTSESFTRNWTQEQYSNFRDKIKTLTEKTNLAYIEEDQQKSIKKWKEVFSYKFPDIVRSSKLDTTNENYTCKEEFIEDKVNSISIDYNLRISCTVKGQNGIRDMLLQLVPVLYDKKKLVFKI